MMKLNCQNFSISNFLPHPPIFISETTSTVIGNVNTEEDIVVTGENREIQGEGIVIGNENVIREADVQGLPSPSKKKQARCRSGQY